MFTNDTGATTLTWMLSFPNSFAKLCDNARSPNFPAAKPDVCMRINTIEEVRISHGFIFEGRYDSDAQRLREDQVPTVVLPLSEAVAPVNSRVPRFPSSFKGSSLNARMTSRENENAAVTFVFTDSVTSSSVSSRKGFQTP